MTTGEMTSTTEGETRRATLIEAYWRLRDQADRDGSVYHEMWAERYDDPASTPEIRRYARDRMDWIKLGQIGILSAASTIAVMLGVRGCDIERPEDFDRQLAEAQDLATDDQILAYWDDYYSSLGSIRSPSFSKDSEARMRAQRIADTRANPEQMRKVAEWRRAKA